MLFRIFKGSRPVVLVIIVIFGVLLWLKSFVLQSVSEFSFDFHQLPFYQFISGIFNKTNLFSLFLSFILFVIHGFLMNRLNKKYILIKERTYLPALFFILISASYIPLQRLSPVIISSIILLFVIELIFDSYKKEGLNLNYFTSSFLLILISLFF